MRIDKTIKGEKILYNIQILPNTMSVKVRYFMDDEPVIGKITEDFNYIILPDSFLSPYITDFGQIKVGKLKIPKYMKFDVMELNGIKTK